MSLIDDDRSRMLAEHEEHYGSLDILDWDNPRSVIDKNNEHDDLAYSIAGAWHAAKILRGLDLHNEALSAMSLIDVGCGTGKVTRILQMFVASADGWDPKAECIQAARSETGRCTIAANNWPPEFHASLPNKTYDIIVCTDVLPGLGLRKIAKICATFSCLAAPRARLVANVLSFREPSISTTLGQYGFRMVRHVEPGDPEQTDKLCMYIWERDETDA